MSTKKPNNNFGISEEERQSFLNEVADVRRLVVEKRIEAVKNKSYPKPKLSQDHFEDEQTNDINTLSDPISLKDAAVEDVMFFARTGIQQKVQKKLRRGEFPIEETLDLHGYTVIEAKTAIQDFLHECKRQGIRYIQIVHGKGYRSDQNIPVIKTHVAYWLPQLKNVLAFSSALPKDGGTGAIYVILKLSNK